jgi:hypothetical protein
VQIRNWHPIISLVKYLITYHYFALQVVTGVRIKTTDVKVETSFIKYILKQEVSDTNTISNVKNEANRIEINEVMEVNINDIESIFNVVKVPKKSVKCLV